jgi:hypothetical protein
MIRMSPLYDCIEILGYSGVEAVCSKEKDGTGTLTLYHAFRPPKSLLGGEMTTYVYAGTVRHVRLPFDGIDGLERVFDRVPEQCISAPIKLDRAFLEEHMYNFMHIAMEAFWRPLIAEPGDRDAEISYYDLFVMPGSYGDNVVVARKSTGLTERMRLADARESGMPPMDADIERTIVDGYVHSILTGEAPEGENAPGKEREPARVLGCDFRNPGKLRRSCVPDSPGSGPAGRATGKVRPLRPDRQKGPGN